MTILQWVITVWIGVPLVGLALLLARDWWHARTARQLEALYRLPSRDHRTIA